MTFTKDQLAAAAKKARAAAKGGTRAPVGVIGADPNIEYRILDLSTPEGRLIGHRDRLEREGWILLETPPQVAGINRAEVWAMPKKLYVETHWAAQVEKDKANRLRTRGRKVVML